MRPLRLELAGFLSYAEPVAIDFAGIRAAAITGPNGAGKTAIVEAMEWAMFGKGRYDSPDAFLTAGVSEGGVRFYFALAGTRYVVHRQRSSRSGGKSTLTLEVDTNDFDGFGWQPLGGERIGETQEAIERLLGMDHDTWMATSFIGQGKADAFTILPPAQRKQLLGEVLNLGLLQRAHDLAVGYERESAGRLAALQRQADQLRETLEDEPLVLGEVDRAKLGVEQREAAFEAVQQELGDAVQAEDDARACALTIEHTHTLLSQLSERRQAEKARAEADLQRLRAQVRQAEGEAASVRDQIAKLRTSSAMAPTLQGVATAKRLEAEATHRRATALLAGGGELSARAHAARESAATLSDQIPPLRERIHILSRAREPMCPACGQRLDEEHREQCIADAEGSIVGLIRQAQEANERAKAADEEAQGLRVRVAKLERQTSALADEADANERAADRAAADSDRISEEEPRLAMLGQRVAELSAASKTAEAEAWRLAEPGEHERRLIEQLAEAGDPEQDVRNAAWRRQELERQSAAARQQHLDAVATLARAQSAIARLEEARTTLQQIEGEIRRELLTRDHNRFCAEEYGRNGWQARLIELAIPAIEDEANRLLERLTDGRFTVRLESQRPTKEGALRETLDILVSDGVDIRPIKGLSGGERQCVDLAVRIGLARLLVKRTGRAGIETLILDEAFTALDVGRRQRTIEVLRGLLDEFPMVLFITHLDELASAFPARITVSRDEAGSHVSIQALVDAAA